MDNSSVAAIAVALCVAALPVCAATVSQADESWPAFTFGAATSFVYDINRPDDQVTRENKKTYADGKSEESFNIDLVQLGASGRRGRVSYGCKVDFGDWARAIQDDVDHVVALQEMFLAVDAGFGVISAGRMPTPLGYEVLEPWANANISRSRAWSFQSISHDGAAVSGEIGGVSMMAAVVNGLHINDNDANNPDGEYGVITSFGVPVGDTDLRLTAAYSDENDEVRYVELNPVLSGRRGRWRYGLEGTWLDGHRHGDGGVTPPPLDVAVLDATGYGGATFGSWSADVRLSYTHQKGTNEAFLYRNKDGIVSFTVTGGYEIVEGVVVRAEYRVDSADGDIFDDHNSVAAGPAGQTDLVNVVQVQLLWTPMTGGR